MRLSEAIRLGAMLRPKISGFFFKDGASCAQGAALEATGTAYDNDENLSLAHRWTMEQRWPTVLKIPASCPACARVSTIGDLIPHLNNEYFGNHDWTREQIADWVATVEPAETTDPHASTEDVRGGQRTEMPDLALRA